MNDTATQAPKTVGPNLAELTIREQSAAAWASKSVDERRKAERRARELARGVFGSSVEITFDEFVPEPYARRFGYTPAQLVSFNVEGLEFNYAADKERGEFLQLIDRCPHCDTGVRLLTRVESLADIGRFYATREPGVPRKKCAACIRDEEDAKGGTP